VRTLGERLTSLTFTPMPMIGVTYPHHQRQQLSLSHLKDHSKQHHQGGKFNGPPVRFSLLKGRHLVHNPTLLFLRETPHPSLHRQLQYREDLLRVYQMYLPSNLHHRRTKRTALSPKRVRLPKWQGERRSVDSVSRNSRTRRKHPAANATWIQGMRDQSSAFVVLGRMASMGIRTRRSPAEFPVDV